MASEPARQLLQMIDRTPDDDAPRLVYADWLSERGDPRGEFIQLQVARARLPVTEWARARTLATREKQLLDAHREEWLASYDGLVSDAEFERGFVARATVQGRVFVERRQEILRIPLLTGVELVELDDFAVRALTLRGPLTPLTELAIRAPSVDTSDRLHRLAASSAVDGLEVLEWKRLKVQGCLGIVSAIAQNPHARGLTTLRFEDTHLSSAAVAALLRAKNLRKLQILGLCRAAIDDKAKTRLTEHFGAKLEIC